MEVLVVIGVVLVLLLALVGAVALTEKSQLIKAKLRAEIAKLKAEERDITTETEAWLKQEEARVKAVAERALRYTEATAAAIKAGATHLAGTVEGELEKGIAGVASEIKKAL